MMRRATSDEKRKIFESFLARGWPMLYFDPKAPGILLPDRLASKQSLSLQYGLDMPKQIHDLKVSDEGVSATLSFGDIGSFLTNVPWDAVFATSVDLEIGRSSVMFMMGDPDEKSEGTEPTSKRPNLQLVD